MDCVMKSRISRWRSVRAPRVSSRTNVNEPMFCLRRLSLNTRIVRNKCPVSTIQSARLERLEERQLQSEAGADAPGGEDGLGGAVDGEVVADGGGQDIGE